MKLRAILAAIVVLASVPTATAAAMCMGGACADVEGEHSTGLQQYCVHYGASFERLGHAGVACTDEPLCHWAFCYTIFPALGLEDDG